MLYKPTFGQIASQGYRNHPRYRGVIGHWLLGEAGGLKAFDVSGKYQDGVLTDGPTWTVGQFGSALSFDGTDDYVDLTPIPATVDAWSVVGWINITTFASTKGWVYVGGDGIVADQRVDVHTTDSIRAVSYHTTGSNSLSITGLSAGQWYYIAIVRDPVALLLSAYLNGVFFTSTSLTSSTAFYGAGTQQRFIGQLGIGPGFFSAQKSDDIRLYNRAVSEDEVKSLYNDPFLEFRLAKKLVFGAVAVAGWGPLLSSRRNRLVEGTVAKA